ncbi:MAG: UDP-glucose--hexose-1-phosphate uridylyltransferase [Christensenellaceae bacterium]|nr:UDP-glucose--hexose-1-phosphate uridylyltransferase [Christensenellaceae bacterium]
MIDQAIDTLLAYAIHRGLIDAADEIYMRNRLLALLGLTAYAGGQAAPDMDTPLHVVLDTLVDSAAARGIIESSASARERFGAAIMGTLTPWPTAVQQRFLAEYAHSPRQATDWFYRFCHDTNYISAYRTSLDRRWQTATEYGALDITINLSKPEKDPRDIAAARQAPASGYPACLLCAENEGYEGHAGHPGRQNHRILPVTICGEAWGFQYSPYVYYNEHCIVLNRRHIPMVIDEQAFAKLFSFVERFPHYFLGSNADLPIVGGSILSHEHFQGGNHAFPMALASIETPVAFKSYADVEAGIVKWPMAVLRLKHADANRLVRLGARILEAWRGYTDASAGIFAFTDETPHNTITPIARRRDGQYELDLVLRNNKTSAEHPLGIFHPHAELHHIKKENIGLIEVMGLAVLPARLLQEMEALKRALLCGGDLYADALTAKHAPWAQGFLPKYTSIAPDSIDAILQREIGLVFATVLEHAGVFKRDAAGQAAFLRFVQAVG